MSLILRTDNGDFDLFGNEDIVQTLGVFNIADITGRSGDYSNLFKVPLTNNNRNIIGYSDFMISTGTLPYNKTSCSIYVDGVFYKNGFVEVESVNDSINIRFYSGNSTFYDKIKSVSINELDWSEYDHLWNLTNAVAAANTTTGYLYPIIDNNGQTLTGNVLDIRKVLPATFNKTILSKLLDYIGYTLDTDISDLDFKYSLTLFTNKNPTYPSQYITDNSVDGGNLSDYGITKYKNIAYSYSVSDSPPVKNIPISNYLADVFVRLETFTNQGYWDSVNRHFNVFATGVYNYDLFIDMADWTPHDFLNVDCDLNHCAFQILPNIQNERFTIDFIREVGGVPNVIYTEDITSATTLTGSINLYSGDVFYIRVRHNGTLNYQIQSGENGFFQIEFTPTILSTNTLSLTLDAGLTFGGMIFYNTMLPNIKGNDWLKDMCVRFGILLTVNEDTKVISIHKFDDLYNHIPNSIDWSDKLDESDYPDIKFSLDTYARNNYFKHKFDKSIITSQDGTDYNLTINNSNLEIEKTVYTSPYGATENVDFNGTITSYLDLYDTDKGYFLKDVAPRIVFYEAVPGVFQFTDGSTTTGSLSCKRVYFIDNNVTNLSMGFGNNLIQKNSITLVNILQDFKLVKAKFNLNILDIINIDYTTPVYISQFQAYFFISSINQFNFTNKDLTEVELLKLNQ